MLRFIARVGNGLVGCAREYEIEVDEHDVEMNYGAEPDGFTFMDRATDLAYDYATELAHQDIDISVEVAE